jgi:hypothetical protein
MFTLLIYLLYRFAWDSTVGRTVGLILIELQSLMLIAFFLIVIFKWHTWCRILFSFFYIVLTIFECMIGNLHRWYIIIPVYLFTEIYMIWNLGGIINCVIAAAYKKRLDSGIENGKAAYQQYVVDLKNYNLDNGLNYFRKIRKKWEPFWEKHEFHGSGIAMFELKKAFRGIDTDEWDRSINELDQINSRIGEKQQVFLENKSLQEEKNMLFKAISTEQSNGLPARVSELRKPFEKKLKIILKKEKKSLNRRL